MNANRLPQDGKNHNIIGYLLGLHDDDDDDDDDDAKENGTYYTGLKRGYVGIIGYILGLCDFRK